LKAVSSYLGRGLGCCLFISFLMMARITTFSWGVSVSTDKFSVFSIDNAPGHQGDPAVWGNWIVWAESLDKGKSFDIYGLNIFQNEKIRISYSGRALAPDIFGNQVVWSDRRNGNYDIYIYDLLTKTESVLYQGGGDQADPAIYGDIVVWREGKYPHWSSIRGYDMTRKELLSISSVPGNKWYPDIYKNTVVWGDYRNKNWDIYSYDLQTKAESVITVGQPYQREVAVYEDIIAFENGSSIGIYNLSNEAYSYYSSGKINSLSVNRNMIVTAEMEQGDSSYDIYAYNYETGAKHLLYSGGGAQYSAVIGRDFLVWCDDGAGGYFQRDIFAMAIPENGIQIDLNQDQKINLNDIMKLTRYWLESDCEENINCREADINVSGRVDINDLTSLIDNWLFAGPAQVLSADFNNSQRVDLADLEVLASHWLESTQGNNELIAEADLNGSGRVDIFDLILFMQHWLKR